MYILHFLYKTHEDDIVQKPLDMSKSSKIPKIFKNMQNKNFVFARPLYYEMRLYVIQPFVLQSPKWICK